jgi:hypothetical protein
MSNSRKVITGSQIHWYRADDTRNIIYHRDELDPKTGLSLPAYEDERGYKSWWLNGNRHRLDGPAIEFYGNRHRLDGPAIEFCGNQYGQAYNQYWINGKHMSKLDGKYIYGKEKVAKLLLLV